MPLLCSKLDSLLVGITSPLFCGKNILIWVSCQPFCGLVVGCPANMEKRATFSNREVGSSWGASPGAGSNAPGTWLSMMKRCLLPGILQVREDGRDWVGGGERLLCYFGLSLWVPGQAGAPTVSPPRPGPHHAPSGPPTRHKPRCREVCQLAAVSVADICHRK